MAGEMDDWSGEVLAFWFGLGSAKWFVSDPEADREIRARFLGLWEKKRQLPASEFVTDPASALAGVILFDQFPRNMFRGHADQFSTDELARQIASAAIGAGFDDELKADERVFLYLPFEHSEDLKDQERSLLLFARLGNANYLDYAKKHHAIIARFGRFPHRNAVLGRNPRAEEFAAGNVNPF